MKTIVIVVSKRPGPILTLGSYNTVLYDTVILADPNVFEEHSRRYDGRHKVFIGGYGIGPQTIAAYNLAAELGAKYWVRLDDDLPPKTFVDKYGFPDLDFVIEELVFCIDETKTGFAGVANSTNKSWLKDGYSRTYGMIHGGCNIAKPSREGWKYTHPHLPRNGDVWRSAAHRLEDGAVGRVQHIGFDKGPSTLNESTLPSDEESTLRAKDMIEAEFGPHGVVSFDGWREIGGKRFPNWRMLRGKHYRAKP
jgi:hypothetical protein